MINDNDGLTRVPIPVRLDELEEQVDQWKSADPFNKSWEEIKTLDGLDLNFKRRVARTLSKTEVSNSYMDSALAIQLSLIHI